MKKFDRVTWAVLMFSVITALVMLLPPKAHAYAAGCHGKIRTMRTPWYQETSFGTPFPSGMVPEKTHEINHTADAIYWYCPNGRNLPSKVKPRYLEYCWYFTTDRDEEHFFFDGVRFNSWFTDSAGTSVDPPKYKAPDDGSRQNCVYQSIPSDRQRWMWLSDYPRWRVSSTVIRAHLIDEGNIQWDGENGIWMHLRPRYDMLVEDWW